jgi:hypothetical protein
MTASTRQQLARPGVDVMAVLVAMQDQLDDLAATVAAQQTTMDRLTATLARQRRGDG